MKKLNLRKTLLGVALLGSFAAPVATSVAQADPPDYAPAYGRRAKDKKDKRDRRDDRYNRDRDDNNYDNRDDNYDRDNRDNYDRNNNRNNATYTGTVTNVRAGNSFDLRANGRTYNVYTPSGVPRGLSRGDEVRVYGRLSGDNDIRNASVSILTNRRDNNGRDGNYTGGRYDPNGKLGGNGNYGNGGYGNGNYGNGGYGNSNGYQSYTGVVTNVRSSREFDVRINGRTYNVYASASTRGLSKGDEVSIYGQRSGDNDIRNANARITRNR